MSCSEARGFEGVDIDDLLSIEKCFDIHITVLQLNADGLTTVIWTSSRKDGSDLYLDLHDRHFSYIKDIEAHASDFLLSQLRCVLSGVQSSQVPHLRFGVNK